ncbi:MAG: serine/threonine protein kinase [Hormoscilla sp. GUM202]|nr:serine/threonine protein kinase [Hormoscilla sp. GUM202]
MMYASPIPRGTIVEKQYRIKKELGRGGFGRTYLAEDTNRYNELCVLKEFAPQAENPYQLRKAEELFQREAGMLYKLEHPQIPRFRELLRANIGDRELLFLVQDYVEGPTYWQLFEQGRRLSEAQATQLLEQLLPVLEYVHSKNVIHRDISPDNLIQRSSDGRPVLIDFGSVKQIAATALYESGGQPGTRVGKPGFCPEEQMHEGKVSASSDLYAVGMTVLVLLTGKEPQHLQDWERQVNIGPNLKTMLKKMLAQRSRDRYQSAAAVTRAMENSNTSSHSNSSNSPRGNNIISQMSTRVVGNLRTRLTNLHTQMSGGNNRHRMNLSKVVAIALGISLLSGVGAFALVQTGIWEPFTLLGRSEVDRQKAIYQRIQELDIDEAAFNQKVNDLFYAQYPVAKGRTLTENHEDAVLRSQWYRIAEELLDKIEQGSVTL